MPDATTAPLTQTLHSRQTTGLRWTRAKSVKTPEIEDITVGPRGQNTAVKHNLFQLNLAVGIISIAGRDIAEKVVPEISCLDPWELIVTEKREADTLIRVRVLIVPSTFLNR